MKIPILRIYYSEEDINYIKNEIEKVLRSGYLTMSDRVREFEVKFASFCGTRYAVGTNSGTSSIEIILRAIGIENSTVIVPSNTYMATALAVIKAGGRVIFAECEKDNLQLDPDDIERKIQSDTKGVIIVHIGGIISPNIERIKDICRIKNIFLIEDAAHAHGATIDGEMAGSLTLAGSFSFYPTKVLTTAEGGMITTSDDYIYNKAIILREHGKSNHNLNIHSEIGDNWRFSEIHAVLGIQQMIKADWILMERRRIAEMYNMMISKIEGIEPLIIPENIKSSYYKYIVLLQESINRNKLKKILKEYYEITLPGEVYAYPCHSQPVFNKYPQYIANSKKDIFPITEYVCSHHICLPLYPGLKDNEIEYILSSLREAIKRYFQ